MIFRYKLIVEYDGLGFTGWQKQVHGISVQKVLEDAIQRLTGISSPVFAAGRTDAGVHASHQVIHFDTHTELNLNRAIPSLNHFLHPHLICIGTIEQMPLNFHARFSAISRSYIYHILNRRNPTVLLKNRVWHVHKLLDVYLMQEAAQLLVGIHDFTSFRSARCQSKNPIKTINSIKITTVANNIIETSINAPSFLHNQVRIIVGALKKIGEGEWTANDIERILKLKDRTKSAPTAPAYGLYLSHVEY